VLNGLYGTRLNQIAKAVLSDTASVIVSSNAKQLADVLRHAA
jgi:hypothetical protein